MTKLFMTKPTHLLGSTRTELIVTKEINAVTPLRCLVACLSVTLAVFLGSSDVASAAGSSPWWHLNVATDPSVIEPGSEPDLIITASNLGDAEASSQTSPVTITDTLPAGLEAIDAEYEAGVAGNDGSGQCEGSQVITCEVEFTRNGHLPPFKGITVTIYIKEATSPLEGTSDEASISGGGASSVSTTASLTIGPRPTPFGLETFELNPEGSEGSPITQAGSHPFQLTGTVALNQKTEFLFAGFLPEAGPAALPRDLHFASPPGLLGNPVLFYQCREGKFQIEACPSDAQIGVAQVKLGNPLFKTITRPIFNMLPAAGEPARFGFNADGIDVFLDASVRSPGDYGITLSSNDITQTSALLSSQVTLWGVPGDPRHDSSRGYECAGRVEPEGCPEDTVKAPFLVMPTNCEGPFQSTASGDSWAAPGKPSEEFEPVTYTLHDAGHAAIGTDGCNRLSSHPHLEAEPTSDAATTGTGLEFELSVADSGYENPEQDVQSQIKKTVVTLPEGLTTNPSVAAGLAACTLAEYEAATDEPGTGCSEESKIGSVEIESPLVKQRLEGSLYVAKQGENPFHNLLSLYLIARNPEIGVIVKASGRVEPNERTGQLVTTFDNLPQLPFSRFHLSFRSGQRSPLITPPACGTYTTTAELYPWSDPGTPVKETATFKIDKGPENQGCPSGGVPPFHPDLQAGTIDNAAGHYSPFSTHITRRDSEQEITHFSIKLPPGVIGKLAGVSECSDAAITAAKAREHEGGGGEEEASPSCPKNSEVGHSLVGSGVGNVLAYAPGKLYLAGPYHGSNLSIVSITAAKVGPFDLGTVVVRFALRINPETAEVSVDGQASDPIPHIVDGIPVHLRDIRAYVDRPEFTSNPTSCEKTSTASTVLGSGLDFVSALDDQPVTVTSPFQAADCASLGYKPKLKLSLKGSTRRGGTPAFKALFTPRPGDANTGEAQVTLPHSEFLDNAHIGTVCTRVQFAEGNVPGEKCPPNSVYGHAKAITPILSEPLEGPVYLRSTGTGAGHHLLPDLVAALHNSQVNIALDGHVEGVHGGIRNTFEAVPDAPVTQFTLEMQGGSKGLLENSTNLCAKPNHASAVFTGHNGKVDTLNPLLSNSCKKAKKHHKRRSAHR